MATGWDAAAEVAAWPGYPPLERDRGADACVIGLGSSGLAAAADLSARGLDVIAVDAGRVAAGAAGRNGGFLLGGPAMFLHRAIAAWGEPAAVGLYRATLAELDRLRADLGPGLIRRDGSIRLAGLPGPPESDDEARERDRELADCAAHAAALIAQGIAVAEYAGELGQGLYLPDDGAMNPAAAALASAARLGPGVALHEHTPALSVDGRDAPGGRCRVRTPHATIEAELVIVAVDGRAELLLPELPIRTARLQMLVTDPAPPGRLPCPVYGRWGYDYAQQDPDGRLFVGGGRDLFAEQEWTAAGEPTTPVQHYLDALAARFAGTPVRVAGRWAASVGFTADGRPVCARPREGVLAIGGYSGTGNLVGRVAARAAVALALDGTDPPPWLGQ